MNRKSLIVLFGVVAVLNLQACTSDKGSNHDSVPKNAASAASNSQPAQPAQPPKCPDGSDPIQVPGVCEGTWRPVDAVKGKQDSAECHFVGKLVNCDALGYANFPSDGRSLCYGESVFPFEGKTVNADQCLKKYGMPSHASKFTLGCCKK